MHRVLAHQTPPAAFERRFGVLPPLELIEPTKCHIGWDILLETTQPRAAIEDVFLFVCDDAELVIEPLDGDAGTVMDEERAAGPVSAMEVLGTVPSSSEAEAPVRTPRASVVSTTMRVAAERLDALMDQVGELVITQARLSQIAHAANNPLLSSVAEEIERLSAELRDSTMAMRMMPIGTLFGRFRRVVHDLSAELGKQVELILQGEATELDKTVIERMGDSLIHLIRNAVDHGVEPAEQRLAAGKPAKATIRLEARQSGAEVVVSISDDGVGLNRARIREKAIARGLIASDADLSDREIDQLVFHPGFSTAAAITNVSGRGVGMDVVKRAIEGLRGTVEIVSKPGRGATVVLHLPLTLAIIDGLLIRVGGGMFVIPLASVEECVELAVAEHKGSKGRSFLDLRGTLVPFLRLSRLFNLPGDGNGQMVVIVGSEIGRVGLVVDQVIGHHQTVIKSLSRLHRGIHGLAGATILGDGRVALIIDVPPLIQFAKDIAQECVAA